MIGRAARVVQRVLWIPVGYVAVLTVAGLRTPRGAHRAGADVRFVVLVPAHNEESGVATTVSSLHAAAYPAERRRIVVVADNCSDATAERARAAGAEVWDRDEPRAPGKGPALRWGLDRLLADDDWDALVVVDADTLVGRGFFSALASRLADGAAVVQAEYRVANPHESLTTRFAEISFAVQSVLRQRGRSALGASAKLQGNGMVFVRAVAAEHGWAGEGLTEDVDMWLHLLERGIRPRFEPGAVVAGLMPVTRDAARVQRARWEAGRTAIARRRLLPALGTAIRRRDPVLFEAAVSELVFPPLSTLAALVVAAGIAGRMNGGRSDTARAQLAVLGAHAVAALAVTRAPRSSYALLALTPAVVAWKLAVKAGLVGAGSPASWERTPRPGD